MCQSADEYPALHLRISLLGYQTDILSWVSERLAVVFKRARSFGEMVWMYVCPGVPGTKLMMLSYQKPSCVSESNLDANPNMSFP